MYYWSKLKTLFLWRKRSWVEGLLTRPTTLGEPITLQNVTNRLHQKKGFLGYKDDPPTGESDPLPRTTFFP